MHIVVGLGNPGEEYARTRHNAGRMAASFIAEKVEGVKVLVPDTFMNHSGKFVAKHIKSKKAAKDLIVIHDDLDLPLGTMKVSFNRGSGGHNGLESVIKTLKTREFIRIRLGISPKKPARPNGRSGGKPSGPTAVEKHILSEFKKPELETLKKVFKTVVTAVETIKSHGLAPAMTEFN